MSRADSPSFSSAVTLTSRWNLASILIAEGNETVARLFVSYLVHSGHQAAECEDFQSAVSRLNSDESIDLILLSYRISGGDGLSLIKVIRSIDFRSTTPILMVTGSPEVELPALQAGATAVLPKPVDLGTLLAMVERLTAIDPQTNPSEQQPGN